MGRSARQYGIAGAVALIAAAVTVLPWSSALQRQSDELDAALASARAEIDQMPEQARRGVEAFWANKRELELKIEIINTLIESRRGLGDTLAYLLARAPEGVSLLEAVAGPQSVGVVFETPNPRVAVRFAESLAATPGFELVDLQAASDRHQLPRRFFLSARAEGSQRHGE